MRFAVAESRPGDGWNSADIDGSRPETRCVIADIEHSGHDTIVLIQSQKRLAACTSDVNDALLPNRPDKGPGAGAAAAGGGAGGGGAGAGAGGGGATAAGGG